jgi:hypothetical protein
MPADSSSQTSEAGRTASRSSARTCEIPHPEDGESAAGYEARIRETCHAGDVIAFDPGEISSNSHASASASPSEAGAQATRASLDAEAVQFAQSYLHTNHGLITCGARTFAYEYNHLNWDLLELANLELMPFPAKTSDGDRLRGIDYKGDVRSKSGESRKWMRNRWATWEEIGQTTWSIPLHVQHKNGQWEGRRDWDGVMDTGWHRSESPVRFNLPLPEVDCASVPKA